MPAPRWMDIGIGPPAGHGRPPDQPIRRLDDDHAGFIGKVEGLLDVGWMHLGDTVVCDLAAGDEGGDGRYVGPGRGTHGQARGVRKGHPQMVGEGVAATSC